MDKTTYPTNIGIQGNHIGHKTLQGLKEKNILIIEGVIYGI